MLIKNPINLLPKQTEAWDSLEGITSLIDELGYGGGAGGGKTNFGCKLAIFLSDAFPGARGAIGRFELKNLKRTTLASFFEEATKLGLKQKQKGVKDWDYDYNQQDGKIIFNNGDKAHDIPASEILILDTAPSPKDPEYTRFGGLELSWCWIDESNETPAKAIEILGTRVGRRNNLKHWQENLKKYFGRYDEKDGWVLRPIFLETFNPEKGHIYARFWKPFKTNTMPSFRKFVRALASDNPFLPSAYITAILRKGKATIERLIHGNFDYDDDPTKIFIYDKITDLFSNVHVTGKQPILTPDGKHKLSDDGEPLYKPGERYLIGDVAGKGKDKTVLYVWEGLRVIAMHTEAITDQDDLYNTVIDLKTKYNIPTSNILLDYDGIGVGIVDRLKCKGFQNNARAFTSDEEKDNDLKANYKNLRSQCWIKLSEMVNDALIFIDIKDEDIKEKITEELDVIKELDEGNEKPRAVIPKGTTKSDDTQVTIKSLLGRSPDFGDGLMMRMYYEVSTESVPSIDWL